MSSTGLPATPPPEWKKAVGQFNAHEFWESHETLEAVWLPADEPYKTLLQGIIQAAAACHHILVRVNAKGALSLFAQSLEKLHRVRAENLAPPWLDLDTFITDLEAAQAEVQRLGPEKLHLFCPGKLPTL